MSILDCYREVWCIDFEFHAPEGERPTPICMVAREYHTGRLVRLWGDELEHPPFCMAADVLIVAYYSSAEFSCFIELGWPMPLRVLDLFCEFRNLTNGLTTPCGSGLLGALAYHGVESIGALEKQSMQQLAMRGGPFTEVERRDLLDYCQSDVDTLAQLLSAMLPRIDLPRALFRGRYMVAVAHMEATGVPIDVEMFERLNRHWEAIKSLLIQAVNVDYDVYIPTGQRTIDPQSPLGAAILREAGAWDIDPHQLLNTVEHIWRIEREAVGEHIAAVSAARKRTGLTVGRIALWENAGNDYSTWPALDVMARELAAEFPALGIGTGFQYDGGFDDADYTGNLWELLRAADRRVKPKHHPDILNRGANLVVTSPAIIPSGPMSFSSKRFAAWLVKNDIPWPRLESGDLDLSEKCFRQMSRQYAAVSPLRELRHSLSELRLNDLLVGSDGRNRTMLSAFRAKTGRNQPSNAKFIFGPSCWFRGLIKPTQGRALAYIDWSAQEIGIAAKLSRDTAMQDAYLSGDPYLWLGKVGGVIPQNATKKTHGELRDVFKVVYLAANYGMAEHSLAQLIGQSEAHARELLRLHHERFPIFWAWSDGAVNHAMLKGWLHTVFGWRLHVGPDVKPTSLRNFPVQANGAEMLRLACCLATERGIAVCCPVHDALLVEGAEDENEDVVRETQAAMREASEVVLNGFALRTDAKIVHSGERYMDPRGERMWGTVQRLLEELEAAETCAASPF
ncbi:MAG: DNA polymerase [Planctomycetaceae bacterium]